MIPNHTFLFFLSLVVLFILTTITYFDLYVIPFEILVCMVIFWIVFMVWDIRFTTKHETLMKHEQSFIFSYFLKKTSISNSVVFTIMVEVFLIIVFPITLLSTFDFQSSAIISLVSGLVHIYLIIQIPYYNTIIILLSHNPFTLKS